MKTSIATVSISGNFEEKLEAIAAAGFHGLEIFEQDLIAHDANPREVGEMIRSMGLESPFFNPFVILRGCQVICAQRPSIEPSTSST